MGEFKSVYAQLMSASPVGGGLSPRQEAALRDLDGVMVAAEHVLQGTPVGAGAHSTICALLMDAYAKGQHAADFDVARHAEELHAEHHPHTFVPSLDSCAAHTRTEYEELVRSLPKRKG